MSTKFQMLAKTLGGLEEVLAEELRGIGADNVEPGRRSVSFEGDLAILYKANLCCRTALRILKPIYSFVADDTETLYERIKEFDWSTLMSEKSTFAIDSTVYSDTFRNSRFVTYRVKDAIVDQFTDRLGEGHRPGVRLTDADVLINVHIADRRVTVSLDSSGESLHKRGYRVAQTEAPINEVLAAGIIMLSGWRGDTPFVDPMCGSGTFLIEAAMIAAGINPGIYRKGFAFERWADFDPELFESIYNDDSAERTPACGIYGADISPKAIAIATRNIKEAGLSRYITLEEKALSKWSAAPEEGTPGVLVTNPPYGERISADDMTGLYKMIGTKLKHIFRGYHAWIIGYQEEYFHEIGLSPSLKLPMDNGGLDCELREYIIFDGDMKSFKREGGSIESERKRPEKPARRPKTDRADRKPKFEGKRFDRRRAGDDDSDETPRFERFSRKPRFDRNGRDGRNSRDGRDGKPLGRKPKFEGKRFERRDRDNEPSTERDDSLNRRRNDRFINQIGRQPSLPPSESGTPGVVMRRRKGWRRRDDSQE